MKTWNVYVYITKQGDHWKTLFSQQLFYFQSQINKSFVSFNIIQAMYQKPAKLGIPKTATEESVHSRRVPTQSLCAGLSSAHLFVLACGVRQVLQKTFIKRSTSPPIVALSCSGSKVPAYLGSSYGLAPVNKSSYIFELLPPRLRSGGRPVDNWSATVLGSLWVCIARKEVFTLSAPSAADQTSTGGAWRTWDCLFPCDFLRAAERWEGGGSSGS